MIITTTNFIACQAFGLVATHTNIVNFTLLFEKAREARYPIVSTFVVGTKNGFDECQLVFCTSIHLF
jgi:hypothetical protein